MNVLHTSDWHLGRSLYGKKRHEESSKFLSWLLRKIQDEQIDLLLVAGDIFDTTTPGNRAQSLYYQFLHQMSGSGCRHIVIIAGNHDSPSFLNAPKSLLRQLGVHVVGQMSETLDDEVIVLYKGLEPEAIICAVPYLRDRDLRTVEPGETIDEKNAKLTQGLSEHYRKVCELAEKKRQQFVQEGFAEIPVIGMGHLFTAGGKTEDGDGVRELYVGSLAHFGVQGFPQSIDYVALGHLHVPQVVGGKEHIRYSGSPIPMGFGEANQVKKIIKIVFRGKIPDISEIEIPCFQKLIRIRGQLIEVLTQIRALKDQKTSAWLEVEITGNQVTGNLRETLDPVIEGTNLELCRIKNTNLSFAIMKKLSWDENLEALNVHEVFDRCLEASKISEQDRCELISSYKEIVRSVFEDDINAH